MDELFPVASGVFRLTVNLDSDDIKLFEDLWPVPDGIALHAYLIEGERRVLVDPWSAGGYGAEEIEADLVSHGLRWKDIHAVAFTKTVNAPLMASLKQVQPSLEFWGTPSSGARHDLGGVVLSEREGFWFVEGSAVALTGDALAGLGWIEDEVWGDELGADAVRHYDDEALRWFCGRPLVPAALPEGTQIVAPAHGCLWKNPERALERARRFDAWSSGDGLGEIALIWPAGKEHDAGFDALMGAALAEGAPLSLFRVPGDDAIALAAGARRASLVVLANGLDKSFLTGMTKDIWHVDASLDADQLRAGLVDHWRVP
jgi:hypothetical protein